MNFNYIFALLALFVLLPFALSLDANTIQPVPCDVKVFLADKCNDLNGADMKVVYQSYAVYCSGINAVPVVIDVFAPVAIGCLDPTGANAPKNGRAVNICNPDEYLKQCCTIDARGAVPFGDLYMGYSMFCESTSSNTVAANEFINFLTKNGLVINGDTRENTVINGLSFVKDKNASSQVLAKSNDSGFNISDLFTSTNLLIIVVIVILLLIAVMIFFSFFFIKMKQNEVVKEMKQVKDKMIALERTYLKGKMDEQTYRKLMQQYQLRMTELELEIARLKKKNNKSEEVEKE